MSTRASISISSKGKDICLFHHFDGYPEHTGKILKDILNQTPHWMNMYGYATALIKNNEGEDTIGFELWEGFELGDEYRYYVDFDNRIIKCHDLFDNKIFELT